MSADRTPRHIVLDADTAAVARTLAGATFDIGHFLAPPLNTGVCVTHIGGHPVETLVAAHDKATVAAEALNALAAIAQLRAMDGDREVWEDCLAAADLFDEMRRLLIPQALVDAAHQQWADTEGAPS